jgi:hypothetical protein
MYPVHFPTELLSVKVEIKRLSAALMAIANRAKGSAYRDHSLN